MDQGAIALVRIVISSIVVSLIAVDVRAAVIVSPTAVLGTDMGVSDPQLAPLENMINQSGLDKPFTSGVTDFDAYFNTGEPAFAQAAAGNNWQSETFFTLPVMGTVDFDFGAVYSIDRLAVWNISMRDIKIHISDSSIASLQEVASLSLPNHLNFPFSYRHDLLDLGAPHDVRFLRIEIDSVHLFSPTDTFGFAIVGEIVASAAATAQPLDGDYNANGTVDAADYVAWRENLGTNFVMPNDTTPGDVGLEDYAIWRANYAATGGTAAISAPEPAAWVTVLIGLCVSFTLRRRR
jgi:hypothetical protein